MPTGGGLLSLRGRNSLAFGELPTREVGGGMATSQGEHGWRGDIPCPQRAQTVGGSTDLPWGNWEWEDRSNLTFGELSLRDKVQTHPWGVQSEPHPSKSLN